jgi:hypothetical protein
MLRAKHSPLALGAGLVAGAGAILADMRYGFRMPLLRNMIRDFGLGPYVMHDSGLFVGARANRLPASFWAGVTAVAAIGAVLLLVHVAKRVRHVIRGRGHFGEGLLLALGLSYGLVICALETFDRYTLLPLAVALVLLSRTETERTRVRIEWWARAAAGIAVCGLAYFAIAGTRHYMDWNRARWRLLDHLTNELRISPDRIDGGFEFNAWHGYDPSVEAVDTAELPWYWVKDDEFVVCFTLLPGYRSIRTEPVPNPLFFRRDTLHLQERISE